MENEAACTLLSMVRHESPPRKAVRDSSLSTLVETTPDKTFRLTRIKRKDADEIVLTYASDDREFSLPVHRGDTSGLFQARRLKAARLAIDPRRRIVYLSWTGKLASIVVDWATWRPFHKTVHQERYTNGVFQLVVQRHTCHITQTKPSCRSCQNPQWRTSCEQIQLRTYLLPMVGAKHAAIAELDAYLVALHAESVETDALPWAERVPQLAVRGTNMHA